MKILYQIIAFILIDFGLIWLLVYLINPDPSVSIGIFLLVPFVIIINLTISGIFLSLKKKQLTKLFLVNTLIASIITLFIFEKGIDRHQNKRLESWNFQQSDSIFRLTRWKKTNKFSISYSLKPGSSWSLLDGECQQKNNAWILTKDSIKMKIIDNKLIGFQNKNDTIEMTKIER